MTVSVAPSTRRLSIYGSEAAFSLTVDCGNISHFKETKTRRKTYYSFKMSNKNLLFAASQTFRNIAVQPDRDFEIVNNSPPLSCDDKRK